MFVGVLIALSCLAAFFLIIRTNQVNYPKGKRFTHKQDGYKATVIVGHDVTCYGNGFIVGGVEKIDGKALAKSAARSMKIVNEVMLEQFGPRKSAIPVRTCVFHFVGPKAFNTLRIIQSLPVLSQMNAYSSILKRMLFGTGPYMTVIRSDNMKECSEKGKLFIHELIHVLSHRIFDSWDGEHTLWRRPEHFQNGRNIERICKDIWHSVKQ